MMKTLILTAEQAHFVLLALQTATVMSRNDGHRSQAEEFGEVAKLVDEQLGWQNEQEPTG